jgi:hypothetical protein
VTKSGGGPNSVVVSTPGGIYCGNRCLLNVASGTVVTLSASPATGVTFMGWGGACAAFGTSDCTLTVTSGLSVSATFSP